jgi:uncharacterized protein (DUF983 family)
VLKPLLKGLKLAAMVECPSCRTQTELGKEKCDACSLTLKVSDDTPADIVMLNMGEKYTPLIECPNCMKLVRVGIHRCPECYEEIPEPYALASAVTVVTNTIACDTAASVHSGDAFAPIAVILTGLFYLASAYVFDSVIFNILILFWPLPPLAMIGLWFYRFGNLGLGDEEYIAARRRLKGSLLLWLVILTVQCLAALALLKT